MAKRKGPRIMLRLVCFDCEWERRKSYGDSGHNVYCSHPDVGANTPNGYRRVGYTSWNTPDWCPVRAARLEAFLRAEIRKAGG